MQIIDGNKIANTITQQLKLRLAKYPNSKPKLVFIRVGDDPASITYVNRKRHVAQELGIISELLLLPTSISQPELIAQIQNLNVDPSVHAILVQAPLPPHLNTQLIFNSINPKKDVDGFSATNLGMLVQDLQSGFIPCTPAGILELLIQTKSPIEGKHVVILGRSLIVGKPLANLLSRKSSPFGNATVTLCHSATQNLPSITQSADVLISALGKPLFVQKSMVKPHSIVIDVGINRIPDPLSPNGYKLVGDVHFETVAPITSKITPVPGGVGPMTVALLMQNTLKAFELNSL